MGRCHLFCCRGEIGKHTGFKLLRLCVLWVQIPPTVLNNTSEKHRKEDKNLYTILMKEDKSLVATSRTILRQYESLVDKIQFIMPKMYGDLDFFTGDYQIVLKYVDQANIPHTVFLEKGEELYKENYINCILPVGIELTKFAGDITMYISVMDVNIEDETKAEVLHTNGITISITPLDDIYGFAPNESFQKMDQEILKLQAVIKANTILAEAIDQNKADDIELSSENGELYLTSNNKKIGTGLSLNNLGNALSDNTKDGLTFMITDEEESSDDKPQYSLNIDSSTNELLLLSNGVVISRVSAQDLGELIVKSTKDDGLNEVLT